MNESTREAKDQLVHDLGNVISDAEGLLRSAASEGGERAGALRADLEARLRNVRARLGEIQGNVTGKARVAYETTDTYVHDNPWQALAVAAGIGALIGLVAGLTMTGRDD
jgi:ElaB/YqjD/DUF883 family membrane-anchored ribosome-binding protein